MNGWVLILATRNFAEANIIKGMLEENEIQVMLLNNMDSSYLNFGEVQLYVPTHLKELAKNLMQNNLTN